jgi:D-3-phosphoglycerate dehydrogenase
MRAGRWDRGSLIGNELRGRTLAVIGLGRIGGEVAARALGFGMDLVGYDPYVRDERFNALRVRRAPTLEAALADADIITIHTPLTDETTGLIGRRELARLRPGAIVVNLARGGIVDDSALIAALAAGSIRGAVLDVFALEPLPASDPIRSLPNVVLTPHIGANTEEAQRNVAVDVCIAVRDALLRDELSRSINVASVSGIPWTELQPSMLLARRAAAVARALLADRGVRAVQRLALRCGPELIGGGDALLAAAAAGVLDGVVESGRLNLINARAIAQTRGLELSIAESPRLGHPSALEIALGGGMQEIAVGGVAAPGMSPRLTRIGGFHVDVTPRQTLIVLTNNDVPGVIGHVGTCLGSAGVNIAEYHQARLAQGGEALAAITVDGTVDNDVRRQLLELPDVVSATVVHFSVT